MKRLRQLIIGLLLMAGSTVMADNYAYLTVEQDSGSSSYALSDISKITFETQNMVLHLANGQEARLPLSGLQKMFFSGSSTGIATMPTPSQMSMKDGILRVSASKGSSIAIHDMNGKIVLKATAQADGETEINLSGMVRGVYIVKVGSNAKKILNK